MSAPSCSPPPLLNSFNTGKETNVLRLGVGGGRARKSLHNLGRGWETACRDCWIPAVQPLSRIQSAEISRGAGLTRPKVRSFVVQLGKVAGSFPAFAKIRLENCSSAIAPGTEPAAPDWPRFSTGCSLVPAGCFSQ